MAQFQPTMNCSWKKSAKDTIQVERDYLGLEGGVKVCEEGVFPG